MRGWKSWAGVIASIVMLTAVGCQPSSPTEPQGRAPSLRAMVDSWAVVQTPVQPGSAPTEPLVIHGFIVCNDGPGLSRLVDVRASSGGRFIKDFSVRDNPNWVGGSVYPSFALDTDEWGTLESTGFRRGSSRIDLQCGPTTGRGKEVGIATEVPTDKESRVGPFRLFYRSGERTGSIKIPLVIVVCPRSTLDRGRNCTS